MTINAPITVQSKTFNAPVNGQTYTTQSTVQATQKVINATVQQGIRGEQGADGHSPVLTWSGDPVVL